MIKLFGKKLQIFLANKIYLILMEENKIICHVVRLDNDDKLKLKSLCEKSGKYDMIDLDKLNEEILKGDEMEKLFKQYTRFKKNNNDKFKEVFKKMTKHWEENLVLKVSNDTTNRRKSILVGKNHHFRYMSKKIDFSVANKFIVTKDLKKLAKRSIKNSIEFNSNEIINGTYPLENLDLNKQISKLNNFEKNYLNSGYYKIDFDNLLKILEFHSNNNIKGKGLWISMDESYNVNSFIHPKKNNKLIAYSDPVLSLISSFENKQTDNFNYNIKEDKVKMIDIDDDNLKKMKKGKYLYFISKENFLPFEVNNKYKFNTQNPVLIIEKEKIENVYRKFKELKII